MKANLLLTFGCCSLLVSSALAQSSQERAAGFADQLVGLASKSMPSAPSAPSRPRPHPRAYHKPIVATAENTYRAVIGDAQADVRLSLKGAKVTGTLTFIRPPNETYELSGTNPAGEFLLKVTDDGSEVAKIVLKKDPDTRSQVNWRGTLTLADGQTRAALLTRPTIASPTTSTLSANSYQGTVGGSPCQFTLSFLPGGVVNGSYFKISNPNYVIPLEGNNPKGSLILREHDSTGAISAEIIVQNHSTATETRWEGVMQNIRENALRKEVVFSRPKTP